jgi:sugar O-acyltransferase (sialic acid O-acetyltransferase NeuD family)
MLIAGAGGHSIELLEVLRSNSYQGEIVFYDDVNKLVSDYLFSKYRILNSTSGAIKYFQDYSDFCIGIGNPRQREFIEKKMIGLGGRLVSVISKDALIGGNEVVLGNGLNIMQSAVITSTTKIGKACLIHINSSIHHNTVIGDYCELSPGCRILGGVIMGAFVSIGANAVIMRNIRIGDGAVIGAGAVVTKDVAAGKTVVGVPAKEVVK